MSGVLYDSSGNPQFDSAGNLLYSAPVTYPTGWGGLTFLTACQRCAAECGVAGTIATTAGQIGSLGRIVNWVSDAWIELQSEHDDWDWMRASSILQSGLIFVPASGQYTTPLGTGTGQLGIAVNAFGKWDRDTFRTFPWAVGVSAETFLDCIDFDIWRDAYMFGAMRYVRTRPVAIAVGPDQSLNLGPPPDGTYAVTGDYWMAPSPMAADTDTPTGLPTRFHMLVVYRAMIKYGLYESAQDVLQRGQGEAARMMAQLEALRLPQLGFAGTLA